MHKIKTDRNRTITLTAAESEYYAARCADNGIIHGDAFEVLPTLPPQSVDLAVADPPYNLSKLYGESRFGKMSEDEYRSFTREWIVRLKPLLKPHGTLYVCCDWRSSLIIGAVLGEYLTVQNRITWQREKGRGAARNWKNSMEDIWFATVSPKSYTFNLDCVKMRRRVLAPYKSGGKPKDWLETAHGNFRDTCPPNFWDDITVPYWSMPENTDHPAQKPEKLIAKLILASSNPGDTVLDPFLGSGTAAVVAKKLGRQFVGIEAELGYCALAAKRLESADLGIAIQGYADGVFWERNTLAAQKSGRQTT
jgi:site-specific DNA-methyltransferase (adenine-specific)